jgi:putative Mg2+ transporter-C (MgtC) family protein
MPAYPTWQDIAVRLLLTLVAGALIGINRERGHAAGLRTTMLVCLAASVAMVQTNLLLATTGKPTDSFAVADVLRLPLGILSGMGFIGAGAIVRRGSLVTGLTTAATLWIVTVIGLCLGGGQLALGVEATVLAAAVLWGLKQIEQHVPHQHRAMLVLRHSGEVPLEPLVRDAASASACRVLLLGTRYDRGVGQTELRFEVVWTTRRLESPREGLMRSLRERAEVVLLEWNS